jgi:hypothetical protein
MHRWTGIAVEGIGTEGRYLQIIGIYFRSVEAWVGSQQKAPKISTRLLILWRKANCRL